MGLKSREKELGAIMATIAVKNPHADQMMRWRVKIDYVSATTGELHVPLPQTNKDGRTYSTDGGASCRSAALNSLFDGQAQSWQDKGGRSGYAMSSAHTVGARVFYGHEKAPPLIELGGAACDVVHSSGELLPFLARNTESVTRIDFAADIETFEYPFAFVGAGRSARQRSISKIDSDSGQTVYIGSPQSDRRLRVYRYRAPHPRAKFLRVECMLRGELAKAAVTEALLNGVASAWQVAISVYGLEHPLIYAARTDRKFEPTLRNEPTSASRLAWIHKQVAPALRAAIASGLITWQQLADLIASE